MTGLAATLAAIEEATAPACATCTRPLGGSPSDDFCSDECQTVWHQARADAAAVRDAQTRPDPFPPTCGNVDCDDCCCGPRWGPSEWHRPLGADVEWQPTGILTAAPAEPVSLSHLIEVARDAALHDAPATIRAGGPARDHLVAACQDFALVTSATLPPPPAIATLFGLPVQIDPDLGPDEIRILDHHGRVLRSWRINTGPPRPGGYTVPVAWTTEVDRTGRARTRWRPR